MGRVQLTPMGTPRFGQRAKLSACTAAKSKPSVHQML